MIKVGYENMFMIKYKNEEAGGGCSEDERGEWRWTLGTSPGYIVILNRYYT
jgi:hypothetical protein